MLIHMVRQFAGFMLALIVLTPVAAADVISTAESVRQRGYVVCGVGQRSPGFAMADERGVWSGLEVDFCHAIGAAVLGKRDAVKLRPTSPQERFAVLKSGEIDVLLRSTPWTFARDAEGDLHFVGALYYDGHRMLVRRTQAVASVLELSGATICVEAGSTSEQAVAEFFAARKMRYEPILSPRWEDALKNYLSRSCTALSAEGSTLAQARIRLDQPSDHLMLPELISKEPLGPFVRQSDQRWATIVRWVLHALIAAEELGITSSNVDAMRASGLAEARRLLGSESALGPALGLPLDWAFQAIRQVGNYGEIFERNLGMRSTLKLERGPNNLWVKGGQMYAPPFR